MKKNNTTVRLNHSIKQAQLLKCITELLQSLLSIITWNSQFDNQKWNHLSVLQ